MNFNIKKITPTIGMEPNKRVVAKVKKLLAVAESGGTTARD